MVRTGSVAGGRQLFRGGREGKFLHGGGPRSWTSPSVFLVCSLLFPKYGALEPFCYSTFCFALPLPSPIGPRAITLFCSLVWRGLHLFFGGHAKTPGVHSSALSCDCASLGCLVAETKRQ